MQTLLLIPTRMDMKQIFGSEHLEESPWDNVVVANCGLGQLLTGVQTTRLLMLDRFDRCLLAGLGGTYDPKKVPVGEAVLRRGFHQYGFGYSEDGQIRSYSQTVIKQLIDAEDYIPATWVPDIPGVKLVDSLSVMSASGDLEEADNRHDWFSDMYIEEMEGYSAALACSMLQVPLASVRGICNIAGDRNHAHWEFEKMGHAVRMILNKVLA